MKKAIFIGIVMISTIFLGGCGSDNSKVGEKSGVQNDNSKMDEDMNKKGEGADGSGVVENEGGMLNKLKSAISSGKKMKCTYKISDTDGEMEITTYMQGDKYKTEADFGQMKTVSVFDGDGMYSWSVGEKTGTKMTMDCMKSLSADIPEEKTTQDNVPKDEEEFVDSLEDAKNLKCESFDDVDFEIPSDVEFADQCEMLKSQQKLMEGFNKK